MRLINSACGRAVVIKTPSANPIDRSSAATAIAVLTVNKAIKSDAPKNINQTPSEIFNEKRFIDLS